MIQNVFSACDGVSCGQIALNKVNITPKKYFASEIDKNPIEVTQHNFPNTIQVGCLTKVNTKELPPIDLLIGGTPCKGFSSSGKKLNFEDPRSKLFFDFVRLKNELQPKYFFMENVSMDKYCQDIISEHLGVQPIIVNSSLVSAQNRVRLYWTNIEGFEMPKDRNIGLSDIIEVDDTYKWPAAIRGRKLSKATIVGRRLNSHGKREDSNRKIPYTQCLEVRASNRNKSNCLTTVSKDNVLTPLEVGRHPRPYKENLPFRNYTITELCRLQNIPEDYFPKRFSTN